MCKKKKKIFKTTIQKNNYERDPPISWHKITQVNLHTIEIYQSINQSH